MDKEAVKELLSDLSQMAIRILNRDKKELQEMKAELDEYVESVTARLEGEPLALATREFAKCRQCACEWIIVYQDSAFHNDIKGDILKEDALEFFFTIDERIISVQKNFFLLGMVDELLSPSKPFTTVQRDRKIANSRIRSLAREQGLNASSRVGDDSVTLDNVEERRWYFGDDRNFLQSSEEGLSDEEALDYLLN